MTTVIEQLDYTPGLAKTDDTPPRTCECGGKWYRLSKGKNGDVRYRCSNKECGKSITVRNGIRVKSPGGRPLVEDWRTQH